MIISERFACFGGIECMCDVEDVAELYVRDGSFCCSNWDLSSMVGIKDTSFYVRYLPQLEHGFPYLG